MKIFEKIASRFTIRGQALARVAQGRACVKNKESESAIEHYTAVIAGRQTPPDVKAMALFNRALVYTSTTDERKATEDLKTVLNMPETLLTIKKSAREKLARIQRKSKREEN